MSVGICFHCGAKDVLVKEIYKGSSPYCYLCAPISGSHDPVLRHISFVGNAILTELKKLQPTEEKSIVPLRIPLSFIPIGRTFKYSNGTYILTGENTTKGKAKAHHNETQRMVYLPWDTLVEV